MVFAFASTARSDNNGTKRKEKKRKEKDSQLQRGCRCSETILNLILSQVSLTLRLAEPVCYTCMHLSSRKLPVGGGRGTTKSICEHL